VRFRLFGTPIEVKGEFWLTMLVLSIPNLSYGFVPEALIFAAVAFASILVHEMGHVAAVRWLGMRARVELGALAGLTHWQPSSRTSRSDHILVSLAGPFAGFAFGALAWGLELGLGRVAPLPGLVRFAFAQLFWVNVVWGAVNLLPVFPLDGGHVTQNLLGPRRLRLALTISMVVAGGAAIYFLATRATWGAVLFGLAAWASYQRHKALPEPPARRSPPRSWN
jgi:membrane-associated protease RseP (regulator of RpoE activity)